MVLGLTSNLPPTLHVPPIDTAGRPVSRIGYRLDLVGVRLSAYPSSAHNSRTAKVGARPAPDRPPRIALSIRSERISLRPCSYEANLTCDDGIASSKLQSPDTFNSPLSPSAHDEAARCPSISSSQASDGGLMLLARFDPTTIFLFRRLSDALPCPVTALRPFPPNIGVLPDRLASTVAGRAGIPFSCYISKASAPDALTCRSKASAHSRALTQASDSTTGDIGGTVVLTIVIPSASDATSTSPGTVLVGTIGSVANIVPNTSRRAGNDPCGDARRQPPQSWAVIGFDTIDRDGAQPTCCIPSEVSQTCASPAFPISSCRPHAALTRSFPDWD